MLASRCFIQIEPTGFGLFSQLALSLASQVDVYPFFLKSPILKRLRLTLAPDGKGKDLG